MSKKPLFHYGYVIVALSFLISAVGLGISNTFGVFLEPMLDEFGWTRSAISAAFSLSTLMGGVIGVVAGRLTDRLGPRVILTASALFLGIGYLLMPLVHNPWQMYIFYGILTGIGTAGTVVPISSTAIRWFSHNRALVAGIISSGMSAGTIIFSQLAGWLITIRDWRFAFIVLGIINLVITAICAQFMKRDPQSIGQLPIGEMQYRPAVSIKVSNTGFTLMQALGKVQFWLFFAANALASMSIFTVMAHLVIHARGLGIPNASAVTLLTFLSITSIISRMTMGPISDKIGHRITITMGMSLIFVSLIWLIISTNYWMLAVFALVFGFAWGTFFVPITPLTAELFGVKSVGTIFGVLNLSFTIGATISPVLAGYIYDVQQSYRLDFILLAAFAFVAVMLMLVLRRNQTPKGTAGFTGN
jgi:MFS family permease